MSFSKTVPGYAAKTYLYTLLAALLCFFLNLSVTMAVSIAGTQKLGVRSGGAMEDGRTLVLEDYDAADGAAAHRYAYILDEAGEKEMLIDRDRGGEDEEALNKADQDLLAEYPIKQGYKENIRSAVPEGLKRLSDWLIQILCIILFLSFPYSNMWYVGDRDRNAVQFGHMAEDKRRGVKVGLLASIPAGIGFLLLVIGKLTGSLAGYVRYYRWGNVCFWPYFNHFIPTDAVDPAALGWGAVAAMIPILLSLPLITGIGYLLGYSEFSVRDKLVYAATGKKPKRRKRK